MFLSAFLSITLAASAAGDTSAATAAAFEDTKPVKTEKICKSIKMTGSRVGVRTCKTKEQWTQSESGMELGQKGNNGNPSPQCALCSQSPGPN